MRFSVYSSTYYFFVMDTHCMFCNSLWRQLHQSGNGGLINDPILIVSLATVDSNSGNKGINVAIVVMKTDRTTFQFYGYYDNHRDWFIGCHGNSSQMCNDWPNNQIPWSKTTTWEATVKLGRQDFAWVSFYPGHFVRFSYILNLAKKQNKIKDINEL